MPSIAGVTVGSRPGSTAQPGRPRRNNLTPSRLLLGIAPPPPVFGVVQRRVLVDVRRPLAPQLPAVCSKCGAGLPLVLEGWELRCHGRLGGCGATLYLVADGVAPIAPAFDPPSA